MIKHFNKGVVRGRVQELKLKKTRNKKAYGDIKVLCSSSEYGAIIVYVRLWGPAKVKEFQTAFNANPSGMYKFTGDFRTIDRDGGGQLFTFNVYSWEPWVPSDEDQPRASFIVQGEVMENFTSFQLLWERKGDYAVKEIFNFECTTETDKLVHLKGAKIYGHMVDPDRKWGGGSIAKPMIEKADIID